MKSASFVNTAKSFAQKAVNQAGIKSSDIKAMKLPLPSLEEQKQIVAEIESEQKIVNENKKLIEIFEKKISNTISSLWS
jgi:type I restriction enzyme M protein